jgi:hypothetical protein
VGTHTSCRSGESTLVDESPTKKHNTKYEYIFSTLIWLDA